MLGPMAPITCPRCGAQVADTQPVCPTCGTPTGFAAPEKSMRTKYVLIGAGALLALGVVALIVRLVQPGPQSAHTEAPQVKKAPALEAAPKAEKAEKPAPPAEVAKAPQPAPRPAPQPVTAKHGVYFLAVYSSREGGELLSELRPVVAQDESAMNEVMSSAASGLALRPLGLACGPERSPYYAWVSSRDSAPQSPIRVQVGAACGFATLAEAAQNAMDACRKRGGCQKDATEIQLYAADVRDGAGDAWRAKPRMWCQFAAGSIVNAWQYVPEKTEFNSGCTSFL